MRNAVKPCKSAVSFRFLPHDILKCILALPGLIWFRPKLVYESEKAKKRIRGGALVIANHIGFFDPVYLQYCIWYRRHHFVCLKKFFESRLWLMFKIFLCIPIDKDNVSIKTMKDIVEHLRCGELVTLFPEGGVETVDGQISSFKSGMILMAIQSGKPIVPVYIRKRKHFYNRLVMCVGEAEDLTALREGRPTMRQINLASEELRKRETALSLLYKA